MTEASAAPLRTPAAVWIARLLPLLFGVVALTAVFRIAPRPLGDSPEYILMTEAMARHGSADLRDEDLAAVTAQFAAHAVEFPPGGKLIGWYEGEDGRRWSYHFWGYSVLGVPPRWLLGAAGGDPLLALPLVNVLFCTAALLAVGWATTLPAGARLVLQGLLATSPALWFVVWAHPEVFSFSCVTLALVAAAASRYRLAIAVTAVGAIQNPQLVLLAAVLWVRAVVRLRLRVRPFFALRASFAWRPALAHAAAVAPLAAYPLFYLAKFGTLSVVGREATSMAKVSVSRALDLLFDLNLGLLPYVPVVVVAWVVLTLASLRRPTWQTALAGVVAAILMVDTLQWNFNHGSSGPSRYVVWMVPFLALALAEAAARSPRWMAVGAVGVALHGGIAWSRGGFVPRYDYMEHSPVAAFVLDRAPRLYNPDFEIFVKRTTHIESRSTTGPYVYAVDGRCRKVLANRTQGDEVRRQCGAIPARDAAFFVTGTPADKDRRTWQYLDY